MEFKELLFNRRSIRDFVDRPVPLALIEEIIQDSCLAPTASNGQPCRFVVIQERAFIERLSRESKRNLLADLEHNPGSPLQAYTEMLRLEEFNVFYNAPCLICVIGPAAVHSLAVDCALTVAYIMMSATARGLGTCWVALGAEIRDPATLAEMGVPADCRIVAPIILGYPSAIPPASPRHAPEIVKVIA